MQELPRDQRGFWGAQGCRSWSGGSKGFLGMQEPEQGDWRGFWGCRSRSRGPAPAPSIPTVWLSQAGASGNFSRLQSLRSTFYSNGFCIAIGTRSGGSEQQPLPGRSESRAAAPSLGMAGDGAGIPAQPGTVRAIPREQGRHWERGFPAWDPQPAVLGGLGGWDPGDIPVVLSRLDGEGGRPGFGVGRAFRGGWMPPGWLGVGEGSL